LFLAITAILRLKFKTTYDSGVQYGLIKK
jgi:hypothetical protein